MVEYVIINGNIDRTTIRYLNEKGEVVKYDELIQEKINFAIDIYTNELKCVLPDKIDRKLLCMLGRVDIVDYLSDCTPCCADDGTNVTCIDTTSALTYSRETYDCGSYHDIGSINDIKK